MLATFFPNSRGYTLSDKGKPNRLSNNVPKILKSEGAWFTFGLSDVDDTPMLEYSYKGFKGEEKMGKNFPSIWAYCFEVKKRLHDPFLATPLHDDRYICQIKKVHHQKRILNTELGSWVDFNAFVPWYPPPAVFLVVFKVSLDFCFLVSFPIQNFPTHLLFDSIFSLLALFDP